MFIYGYFRVFISLKVYFYNAKMYIKKLTQEIYNMRSTWIGVSLINFFIAALMGFLLRSAFVWEINWLDYLNMLHAHSHVAMLGWVYLVLYGLITDYFVPENKKRNPFYNRLFWFTQFSVLGMMVSFPIQGYGAYSISFSCLHILASYLFVWRIWKDMFISNPQVKILTRSSLVFLLISTLGLWALGPVMASMGKTTALYQVAIQFFLHFQFNGWFAMGVLALVFHSLHQNGVELKSKSFFWFFGLLLASIILTFAHILDWAYSLHFLFVLNGAGVIFQLLSFIILMKAGYKIFHLKRKNEPGIPQQLLVIGFLGIKNSCSDFIGHSRSGRNLYHNQEFYDWLYSFDHVRFCDRPSFLVFVHQKGGNLPSTWH